MIEVILLERIERLGNLGQTVKVRPGFARNFLLPNKKALRATKANLELFEKQRAELEARNAADRATAETLAKKIDGLKLVVIRQASEMGQLFGSVTARDVVESAADVGQKLERSQVQIDAPIKTLGLFTVKIKLHPEVTTKVVVNVARSPEEAVVQAEKGAAVIKAKAEKAQVEAAFGAPVEEAEASTEEKPKKAAKKAKKADEEKVEEKTEEKTEKKAEKKADKKAEKEEEPKAKKPAAKKAKKADKE
ncbi:MAG: 50S ribosomal protein L9 [Bdellovibrionales bacterium]|jgi:large subunit ribosomal protein L9